ncbi:MULTISPECIES: hypothetical protein [Streptomyces]|uniref:hypothetical protein n=1 Tax=Streptomyces TaxID=1883 RepID=UPI0022514D3E|nr:hypothetical protein [Streptomyces virginiae]MCX5278174.1 hypothetical protein [Streptomyces virginiae]
MTRDEDEEDIVEITFDFTADGEEPIPLLTAPGPDHPTTILMRGDELMPTRWRQLTD